MVGTLHIITTLFIVHNVQSFAYAPNFITKIVQEQIGRSPQGLLVLEETTLLEENASNGVQIPVSKGVKTRFPPEPNGYLHLGHAKAICFNFALARMFGGTCNMRMDDTNPSKEDIEYVQSILEDVIWIQHGLFDESPVPWEGDVRKTSDYFDLIYDCAVELIKSGDAYVDSLSAEEMREYRGTLTDPGKNSPYRDRTVEENLELFQGMRDGKFEEGAHVLRAKIDMSSPNINMRDPTLFRIKHESHQETGDKWCIYPMYDFSHPISDAVEGITHSICTLEFEDHRPFYDWTIEKLLPTGLIISRPQQIEFSRLNIQNTVLSKRKLIQLVTERKVSGWNDPRMPTLSGIRRRGVPPSGLRLFCERVGISKADSFIGYEILEDCIRETMDEICPRAFCVLKPLKLTISNWDGELEYFEVDNHPKKPEMGTRSIPFGKTIYIERTDFFDTEGPEGQKSGGKPPKGFKRFLPNQNVRLRYAYVIQCNEIIRDTSTNEPIELKCTYIPETRAGSTPEGMDRVAGIIHWVEASTATRCKINLYDRLFSVEEPGKDSGDFLNDINHDSLEILEGAVVEPSVAQSAVTILQLCETVDRYERARKNLYPSSLSFQFERTGYFALDSSSTSENDLVMNRVVTLRDTWSDQKKMETAQRTRGVSSQSTSTMDNETLEDVRRVAFTVVSIREINQHPDADSLLVCKVDCGDVADDGSKAQPRTVVAGLAGKISPNEIIGRKVVAVTNLKPAMMRGIESTAMLLAACDGTTVELLDVPNSVPVGELLFFDGKENSQPDKMMKSKGALKAWDRVKAGLRVNEAGEVTFANEDGSFRMMTSLGPVSALNLRNVAIQ